MHKDRYVFAQLVSFLNDDKFRHIVDNHEGNKYIKSFTCWNQLLVLMFGQLSGRESLRDVIVAVEAHQAKAYGLGFGKGVTRSNLAKANQNRDYHIFEEFAYYMVEQARALRVTKIFNLGGNIYAFDSTTIDLCMGLFEWATFRKTKSGIKIQTQFDISTQVPADFFITNASVHDVKALDHIQIEPLACYIFDKGFFDLARMFWIQLAGISDGISLHSTLVT